MKDTLWAFNQFVLKAGTHGHSWQRDIRWYFYNVCFKVIGKTPLWKYIGVYLW